MSKLIITFDRETYQFGLAQENLNPYYCDVVAALNDGGQTVIFDRVSSFGFEIKNGENVIADKSYPPEGVTYIQSDQRIIQVERVKWQPEMELVVRVWLNMSGQYFEQSFNVSVPIPAQPYPSWTWDGSRWNAPIPMPEEGSYAWDEDTLSWVEWVNPYVILSSSSSSS